MSKAFFRSSLAFVVAGLLHGPAAADAAAGDRKEREPLVITSSRMEAERLGDKVTFTGNVTLKKEALTLSSDTMIVFYDTGSKNIREIDAHGNVIVRKDGRVALSRDASYYSADEKIILTGDAKIIESENQLGGDRITLFMRDDRSIVESGKVLLYQEQPGAAPAQRRRR